LLAVENLTEWEKSDERRKETEFTAVIVTVVAELLRFFICVPIAFITLFTHKTTIAKYTYALQQWLNQQ
jgi:hypothetical protein